DGLKALSHGKIFQQLSANMPLRNSMLSETRDFRQQVAYRNYRKRLTNRAKKKD
ncbi:hypothetical protein SK128_007345, partial [Halocaridina rubra]